MAETQESSQYGSGEQWTATKHISILFAQHHSKFMFYDPRHRWVHIKKLIAMLEQIMQTVYEYQQQLVLFGQKRQPIWWFAYL